MTMMNWDVWLKCDESGEFLTDQQKSGKLNWKVDCRDRAMHIELAVTRERCIDLYSITKLLSQCVSHNAVVANNIGRKCLMRRLGGICEATGLLTGSMKLVEVTATQHSMWNKLPCNASLVCWECPHGSNDVFIWPVVHYISCLSIYCGIFFYLFY